MTTATFPCIETTPRDEKKYVDCSDKRRNDWREKYMGRHVPWGRLTLAKSVRWVRVPFGPLKVTGCRRNVISFNLWPTASNLKRLRKVAGYGSPGRFAKPCGAATRRVGSNPTPSAPLDD